MPVYPSRRRCRTKHRHAQESDEDCMPIQPFRLAPASQAVQVTPRPPRRKAILVGVSEGIPEKYLSAEDIARGTPTDLRSHQDVRRIEHLLLDDLHWQPDDICVMMDEDGIPRSRRPTKRNIRKRLKAMVKHACAGDRLFFFYAGHGLQQECHSDTETDGLDEFIECEKGSLIKDNELNQILVQRVPPGCQLVALFDTCHAGTMLDLPHSNCNKVFTFGLVFLAINRMTHRIIIDSRVATTSPPPSRPYSPVQLPTPSLRSRHRCKKRTTTIPPTVTSTIVPASSPDVGTSTNVTTTTTTATTTTTSKTETFSKAGKQVTTTTTQTRVRSMSIEMSTVPSSPTSVPPSVQSSMASILSSGHSDITSVQTAPPVHAKCQEKCTGECVPSKDQAGPLPHVISLAASKDDELSYEATHGGLMTSSFVEIMRSKKDLTLRNLMIELNLRFQHAYDTRIRTVSLYKKADEQFDDSDLLSTQIPQLSSLRPLDLDQLFVL